MEHRKDRIRPYVPIMDSILFDVVKNNSDMSLGEVIMFYVNESETYKKHKKLFKENNFNLKMKGQKKC